MNLPALHYQQQTLYLDDVALPSIAHQFTTPCFVYSKRTLLQAWQAYRDAFAGQDALICYAMKANSNLSLLKLLVDAGAGMDIVSGGELERALLAGCPPERIVFSGVGKTVTEMHRALEVGIHCFNVESSAELDRLSAVATRMGKTAAVSLRINPDVDAGTHPYISTGLKGNKFGIAHAEALATYRKAASLPGLRMVGIDCHIGSQLTELSPFIDALDRLLSLVDQLAAEGIVLQHVDMGGGIGICYDAETPPPVSDYAQAIAERLAGRGLKLVLEPGRAIVGNAGVLLTRVEFLKQGETKNFAIVDAAMNDLIRPALYEGWHQVLPVEQQEGLPERVYDVVGPVCESADFLAQDRTLAIRAGDLLAIGSAGAYGMAMSSNYNSRVRAAEILVDGDRVQLIRQRETLAQMLACEQACLPEA